MKILKMYIHSLDSHEDDARNLYKIKVFKIVIYAVININKLMLSTRF